MRTTLTLQDDLLAEARRRAADSGRTISEVIETAIRESFARSKTQAVSRPRITLITDRPRSKPGLRPGVNLDDSASLLEIMEEKL